jgi:pantothenate kinase
MLLHSFDDLLKAITSAAAGRERFILAIAGPPGAGKSTLARNLVRTLTSDSARLVPMDGFHYDNAVLDELGLRSRKGAPETFDFGGFFSVLTRIRSPESVVAVPIFDREADLARAGASLIYPGIHFIVVEGNYLLLDESPWTNVAPCFDLTIYLEVSRSELQRRLLQRWLDLGDSPEKAAHWVASNDMPNVDRVLTRRRTPDIMFSAAS